MINKLTNRAKETLLSFEGQKNVPVKKLFELLTTSGGAAKELSKKLPSEFKSTKKNINVSDLIKEAYFQAIKFEHVYVGTEHLLLALLKLLNHDDYNILRMELLKMTIFPSINSFETAHISGIPTKTPLLDIFGDNLNNKALKSLDTTYIYRGVYDSLVSSLLLKNNSNVLLVGNPGVGRESLIHLLVKKIVTLEVPPSLMGYQVIEFDFVSFLSSMFNKGGFETAIVQLVEELRGMDRTILYLKNFQNVFFSSNVGFSIPVFYSMFKNALESTDIQLIGSMNEALYDKISIDNDHMFEDFTVIDVSEPLEEETLEILNGVSAVLGEYHGVSLTPEVVSYIYNKAKDVDTGVRFPQKGVDFMDQCCTYMITKKSKIPSDYKKLVDKSFDLLSEMDKNIESGDYDKAEALRSAAKSFDSQMVQKEKKIFFEEKFLVLTPRIVDEAFILFRDEKMPDSEDISISKLSKLAEKMKKRVIGQEEAIDVVSKSLIRAKMGLRPKKRPLGNFLFLGPTGVGKTELAKVLADSFFGSKALIRLDMSDFSEKHNVSRLVGAPPGYVGFGEGGELTTKIENTPNSVVLFDEIEKAHPDVLNILLQIMEEGELVDAKGTSFDFSRAVVILTSNLGTEILQHTGIGFEGKEVQSDKVVETRLRSNLKKIMKPELLNRFDEIIVFKRLGKEPQYRVLDLLIKEVVDNLVYQDVYLKIRKSAKDYILEKGYSNEYGARALRRTLEKELLDLVAGFLLEHPERPLNLNISLIKGAISIQNI